MSDNYTETGQTSARPVFRRDLVQEPTRPAKWGERPELPARTGGEAMAAPPDQIFAWVATINFKGKEREYGEFRQWWTAPPTDDPASASEYILRDGPTMQAAIAAAEARGRDQGLRDAAAICAERADAHADYALSGRPDMARLREGMEAAFTNARWSILALIPAKETPDE